MKKNQKLMPVLVMLAAIFTVTLTAQVLPGEDLPSLSGLTVKDEHPNGCVDCHVKVSADKDNRLNAELKNVEKHPPVDKIVKKAPDGCLLCHKEGSKAGALNIIVHKDHFSNTKENDFVTNYNGDCLNCHSLDTNTWQMGMKSGPANW